MAKKIWLARHFTPAALPADTAKFYVEEQRGKRWVRVDGPFDTQESANTAAKKYSASHPDVIVQVTVEQS